MSKDGKKKILLVIEGSETPERELRVLGYSVDVLRGMQAYIASNESGWPYNTVVILPPLNDISERFLETHLKANHRETPVYVMKTDDALKIAKAVSSTSTGI